MPYSDNTLRPDVLTFLIHHMSFDPSTVLDVGCGAGSNYEFYKPWWPGSHWTGLEIHPNYVSRFSLFDRYQSLIIGDIREVQKLNYSLVIFGDVLEHLPKDDALRVLDKAIAEAKFVVVSLPIGHYPQGSWEGNEHEAHLSEWTFDELAQKNSCVLSLKNDITGSFVFKGEA